MRLCSCCRVRNSPALFLVESSKNDFLKKKVFFSTHPRKITCGHGRSRGRRLSEPKFSFSSYQIYYTYRFPLKSEHVLILEGWGGGGGSGF